MFTVNAAFHIAVIIALTSTCFASFSLTRCRNGTPVPRLTTVNPRGIFDPMPFGFSHITIDTENGVAHIAGQTSIDRSGNIIGITLSEQLPLIEENIRIALAELRADFADILSIVVYVADYDSEKDLPVIAQFGTRLGKPVNSLIGVQALALPGLRAEVEVKAIVKRARARHIACRGNRS